MLTQIAGSRSQRQVGGAHFVDKFRRERRVQVGLHGCPVSQSIQMGLKDRKTALEADPNTPNCEPDHAAKNENEDRQPAGRIIRRMNMAPEQDAWEDV
jgi:hypothetical protein